jgi:hypothetical protein
MEKNVSSNDGSAALRECDHKLDTNWTQTPIEDLIIEFALNVSFIDIYFESK